MMTLNATKNCGPAHHPGEEFLFAYASGALSGPKNLLAATHLAYCPQCRAAVATAECLGGAMLESLEGEDVQKDASEFALPCAENLQPQPTSRANLPSPLRDVIVSDTPGAGWRNIWFGVREYPIPGYGPAARLLWIPAGRRMPMHDHNGEEWTMVLRGNFSDATGLFGPGDVQLGEPGLNHEPHAGGQGPCLCLVVEEGGLRLTGWWGRWVAWGQAPKGSSVNLKA